MFVRAWADHGLTCIHSPRGFTLTEQEIAAQSAVLVQPTGHNLITWISESSENTGIGRVKEQRLYDRFGLDLIQLLERKDATALAERCRAILAGEDAHGQAGLFMTPTVRVEQVTAYACPAACGGFHVGKRKPDSMEPSHPT